jgi:hypothetical protein
LIAELVWMAEGFREPSGAKLPPTVPREENRIQMQAQGQYPVTVAISKLSLICCSRSISHSGASNGVCRYCRLEGVRLCHAHLNMGRRAFMSGAVGTRCNVTSLGP